MSLRCMTTGDQSLANTLSANSSVFRSKFSMQADVKAILPQSLDILENYRKSTPKKNIMYMNKATISKRSESVK